MQSSIPIEVPQGLYCIQDCSCAKINYLNQENLVDQKSHAGGGT
ncbi:MAG: hypothetical protein PHV55_02215 [Candidatus Omnitrophica bacterium]|nr:hypothetical protein [Candidatus Omnitrophota bacterium]